VAAISDQHRHINFGPRWQCVEQVAVGDAQLLADLRLHAAYRDDLESHRSHAAMLDMAVGCGIRLLSKNNPDELFVPVACDQVVVHRRMPAAIVSHVRATSYDERTRLGTLDVTVASPAGVVVMELLGMSIFGVRRDTFGSDDAATREPASGSPAGLATSSAAVSAPAKPAVARMDAILGRGIAGPEGLRCLERALLMSLPRVVVSAMDVQRTADWLSLPPETPRVPR